MSVYFPASLGNREGGMVSRPMVEFDVTERGIGGPIYLPIPTNVTFSDGGAYSSIDMGVIGENIRQAGLDNAAIRMSDYRSISSAAIANLANNAKAGALVQGTSFAEKIGLGDMVAKAQVATKLVPNPSKNVTFEGNNLRTFNFSFTLVGRTPADSRAIAIIHNTFRRNIYPEATQDQANILLNYPPTWNITFYDTLVKENMFLPKIAPCYLTEFSTNFNPSAMMWKVDGSPSEVQISLTYQETRVQMQFDIESLEAPAGPVARNPEQEERQRQLNQQRLLEEAQAEARRAIRNDLFNAGRNATGTMFGF